MDFTGKDLVILLSHGERGDRVAPFRKPLYTVPFDPALTDLGHIQAQASAQLISKLVPEQAEVHVVSSPFLRCLETAAAITKLLGTDLHVEEAFGAVMLATDFDSDPFDQLAYNTTELKSLQLRVNRHILRPAYPESYELLRARVRRAFEAYVAEHPCRVLVVVTHNFVLEALTSELLGREVHLAADGYCKLSLFTRSEEGYRMLVEADNCHAPQYIRY
jgi:broad specificity phosphatase PhoE